MHKKYDYLIIGAGIVGMTIAYELKARFPHKTIAIIEKERLIAQHASGRNSGVLHAGFYYTANSLKARFTVDGNRLMREFCEKHQLKINPCQKIVIAQNENEIAGIEELNRRGQVNGVNVSIISAQQVAQIDDNIKTHKIALLSPTTATVDPKEVCQTLYQDLTNKGVIFLLGQTVQYIRDNYVETSQNRYGYELLINAAGLYADQLAKQCRLAKNLTLMPFKGIYLKYTGDKNIVKTNIYPVPNLNNPFLGVHFTKTVDGAVKIGPTAIPALWREHYRGLSNFKINELAQVMYYQSKLFARNAFNFRQLAFEEIRKYSKSYFIGEARQLVKHLDATFTYMPAGIRAQLLNTKTNALITDFMLERTANSIHVLNAVSPAFTCSFAFAKFFVDEL